MSSESVNILKNNYENIRVPPHYKAFMTKIKNLAITKVRLSNHSEMSRSSKLNKSHTISIKNKPRRMLNKLIKPRELKYSTWLKQKAFKLKKTTEYAKPEMYNDSDSDSPPKASLRQLPLQKGWTLKEYPTANQEKHKFYQLLSYLKVKNHSFEESNTEYSNLSVKASNHRLSRNAQNVTSSNYMSLYDTESQPDLANTSSNIHLNMTLINKNSDRTITLSRNQSNATDLNSRTFFNNRKMSRGKFMNQTKASSNLKLKFPNTPYGAQSSVSIILTIY